MGLFEDLKNKIIKIKGYGKEAENEPVPPILSPTDILEESFDGPLEKIPASRSEVYKIYGRAPKEEGHLEFKKASMVTTDRLPGDWNKGKHKLYMLAFAEDYFREALRRCEALGCLSHIQKIGCYNHRPVRHDSSLPLSYHSWGMAFDLNPSDNFSRWRAKVSGFPPPFSDKWLEVYKDGVLYNVVMAFKSVGFSWGGDWGHNDWEAMIKKVGIGYSTTAYKASKTKKLNWSKVSYTDPMHFELLSR